MEYRSFRSLAIEFDCSIDTVRRTVKRMCQYIGDRYPPEVIIHVGREWRVEKTAFIDWCKWWPALTMGYSVPGYKLGVIGDEGSVFTNKESVFKKRHDSAGVG